MNWMTIWTILFGTTELFGLNMGFWVAMAVVMIIVAIMNLVFWRIRPKGTNKNSQVTVVGRQKKKLSYKQ